MKTHNQKRLTAMSAAPFLLLLCVAALSPATTARAQARQEVDRNDESTRSIERSSDSSSSRSDSPPPSNNNSSNSSSNSSSSNSSSSSSSNNDSSSSVSSDSGGSSSRGRSGGDEGRRGGGSGKTDNEGRNRNREHPGYGPADDLGSRKPDKKDKDDDKRDRRHHDYDIYRDDDAYRNTSGQGSSYQDECDRGYEQGLRTGASDARRGQPNDPYRSRHYKNGGGGFFAWGRGDAAKQAYRDCFLRGYQEGFQNPNRN